MRLLPREPDPPDELLETGLALEPQPQLGIREVETRPLQPALVDGLQYH